MSTRWDDELTDLVTSRGRALVGYGYALTGDVRRTMLNLYLDETRRFALWRKAQPKVAVEDRVKAPASDITARADVTAALRGLSPRQRACVVLRFYDDLTVPQIAATLGIAEGTIKRHLADGVRALRGVLVPEGGLL